MPSITLFLCGIFSEGPQLTDVVNYSLFGFQDCGCVVLLDMFSDIIFVTKPHAFSFFCVFFCRRLQSSEDDAKRQKAFLEDRCLGLVNFIRSSIHEIVVHLVFRLREAEVRVKRGDNNEIKVQINFIGKDLFIIKWLIWLLMLQVF